MTRKEQIKILDDKIEVNNAQYDLDRMLKYPFILMATYLNLSI